MKIKTATFVRSSAHYSQCPQEDKPEIALIGRSNVGKSSLVNMLLERKQLAKISGRPGKTQLINHFCINTAWHLVDLPGYGWARVSKSQRLQWQKMVNDYFLHRPQLHCVFVLIDARHKPQKIDLEFLRWLGRHQVPLAIVLTKADKIPQQQVQHNLTALQQALAEDWEALPPIWVTSTKTGAGRTALLQYIQSILPHSS